MNIIKDKILYSEESYTAKNHVEKRYVDHLFKLIKEELRTKGDREWLVNVQTGDKLMLSEVEKKVLSIAGYLASIGFKPGDVLQMGCSNHVHFYLPVLAAWMLGGLASMGNPTLEDDKIIHQIQITNSKVVVVAKEYLEKYMALSPKIENLIVLDAKPTDNLPESVQSIHEIFEFDHDFKATDEMLDLCVKDAAVIIWTSGSTGTPKGILHKQETLLDMDLVDCNGAMKALLSTTMYHIGGFSFPLYLGLMRGRTVGFVNNFEVMDFLKSMTKFRPEFMVVSNFVYLNIGNANFAKKKFPFLKKILPIGGTFTSETHDKVLDILGHHVCVDHVYASSETYIITVLPGDKKKKFGLCGALKPGCQLYIADIDTDEKLGPNQLGKMMVKAPTLLKSYLRNPEADQEVFHVDGFGHLGDIGYYTEEGDIFFSYRNKEILRVDSFWFGPADIENLVESIDEVEEAVVWGEYDHLFGHDKINLAIVFKPDASRIWTKEDLIKLVENNLAKEKQITGNVYFVKEIPHGGPLMKKLRLKMRDYVKICKF